MVTDNISTRSPWLLIAMLALATGCSREEIQVYRVPKENPIAIAASSAATHAEAPTGIPQLKWKLPAGWQEQGGGRMTVASFRIPGSGSEGAEVSVMPMPGEGAGNLSLLVNIVREGAGMGPIDEGELAKLVENISVGEASARLVDLSGATAAGKNEEAGRIIVAVLMRSGMTWFFKMAGSAGVVAAQKGAFLEFLKSITFEDSDPSLAAAAPPAPSETRAPVPAQGRPQWEVPHGWQEVPPTQMVLAKFQIGDAGGRAEITVSTFPGDVGGLPANINRWRGQIGLAPLPPEEAQRAATPLDVLGGKGMLVEVNSDTSGQKTRLIGVIVPRDGNTWFYKLLGDDAVAEREKPAFLKFVQNVQYPNA